MADEVWHDACTGPRRVELHALAGRLAGPLLKAARVNRLKRRTGYRPRQDYTISISTGSRGQPGFRVRSFSRSAIASHGHSDGTHVYGALLLTPRADLLGLLLCGREESPGSVEASLQRGIIAFRQVGVTFGAIESEDFGWGPVLLAAGHDADGHGYTQIRFARDGWVLGVGVAALSRHPDVTDHAEAVLRSWTWSDDALPRPPRA